MQKFALSLLAATILMLGGAAAQTDYPTHPVRLIVPFSPGGSTDSQARVLPDYLGRALGHTVSTGSQSSGVTTIMRAQVGGAPVWAGGTDPRREGVVLGDTFVP